LVGDDGPTHHGAFDLSYLLPIPNLVVLAPRDTTELAEMTRWMAGYDELPSVVRYPRGASDDRLPELRSPIELGKAERLSVSKANNLDVGFIAAGSMVAPAFVAAQELDRQGITCEVLNARFLKPLDATAIESLSDRSRLLITIEENVLIGGFGSEVRQLLAARQGQILSLGIPDAFVEHGPQPLLRKELGLDSDGILAAVARVMTPRSTA
jgi:1-deoxy-D-xylulose-5-phosphate synthase